MKLNLEHKSALVCGSTQGIGKATAFALATEGVKVRRVATQCACTLEFGFKGMVQIENNLLAIEEEKSDKRIKKKLKKIGLEIKEL